MTTLMTFAGWGSILAAGVWFLLAAREGGFLLSALVSLFWPDADDRRSANKGLFRSHWDDLKGPFYLLLFGLALLMIAMPRGPAPTAR